ncbi:MULTISPECIES: PP2C family serine/threonine-protein phosphatase [unclassified Fibrobacter]|uniref:PP2C family serine/threonine-protein phosphatase n=1 Tax=unclassified Fibrobacter TaxID=2634177 RepID=UPI000923C45A|nr:MULTISPECIES: PP2C family serine/threonine-protein phosphatase [unclassified Fibrobacter]OWV07001.1 hypothetical protein B7993_04370 [Fibrobacter sp. UWH3]SHK24996.1 Serine/threonine protein phosphatase PrpC [Fibrobacter sp. UWH6]SHK42986.1 Serine/threonine protein phosphatase PrpC [Fibrobacter sp. UWH5]
MLSKLLAKFRWKLLTASVRGPGHVKDDKPNQDCAFVGFVGKFLLVMVCDGLGSHSHSDYGAKILCGLFPECFLEWSKYRPNKIDDLLRLLQSRWLIRVRSLGVDTCGCTCQLAILNPKGKGWTAQLGDGMTLVCHDGEISKFTEGKSGYGNETVAMGDCNLQPYWRKSKVDLSSPGDRLLIMTDGISEDILPQAEGKFVSTFDLFFGKSRSSGENELTKELINWPTPHHLDDKTIVAIEYR